jgi:hypothetical protein
MAKRKPKVKLPIWLLITKSRESPWFTFVKVVCYILLESFWWRYNFSLNFTPIKGLHKKIWASKVIGIPISGILGLPTWESKDKMTFGCNPHGQAIRGKVVASPKSEPWWILWICVCPWCVCAPRMLQLHTNQLVV